MNAHSKMETAVAELRRASQHHAETAREQDLHHFVSQMDAAMNKMMDEMHAPRYTGNPDVDFLMMMIPHHRGAVEMARIVLAYGRDPLTRRLAEDIIASQTAEIAAMNGRLTILRAGEDPNPGGFPALNGTRGERAR